MLETSKLPNWSSNPPETLRRIPEADREEPVNLRDKYEGVLPVISKHFDSIGLPSPVITIAKGRMQNTSLAEIPWDAHLQDNLQQEWLKFRGSLRNHEASADEIH